jgi:uncharacterized protein (DUF1499 family)
MIWKIVGGILVALLVLWAVTFAILGRLSRRSSPVGLIDGQLAPCPDRPNCVCTQALDPAHHSEPIAFGSDAKAAMARLRELLAAQPRCRIVTSADKYLHAECTSGLFGFVDDVEFLIDEEHQRIHFRSASRVGHSDFGVNRRRMEDIRSRFGGSKPDGQK